MSDDSTDRPIKAEPRVLALVLAFLSVAALGFSAFSRSWLRAAPTQLQWRENDMMFPMSPIHDASFGLRSVEICLHGERCWPPEDPYSLTLAECQCDTMSNGEFTHRLRMQQLEALFMLGEDPGDEIKVAIGAAQFDKLKAEREFINSPGNELGPARQREYTLQKRAFAVAGASFTTFGWIALVSSIVAALSLLTAAALVLAKKRVALPIMPTTTALLGLAFALITACLFAAMKPGPPGYVGIGYSFFVFGGGLILGLWSALVLNKLLRPVDPDLLEDAMNPEQF